jgi:hypothetical protein
VRSRIEDWLKAVWFTRAEPQYTSAGDGALQHNLSAQVIVLTRWDHEDVVGWLLGQETGDAPQEWHILNLPAIAEHPADRQIFPDTCTVEPDWRSPGEALCPERFPLSELLKIRSRVGSYWWNALYQQRPSPAQGAIFQRAWIKPPFPRTQPRRFAPLVLSCDAVLCCWACCCLMRQGRHRRDDDQLQASPLAMAPWPRNWSWR